MKPHRYAVAALFLLVACTGQLTSQPADTAKTEGAPAPDGAAGVCCPASTGGCAHLGGYHADGKCDPKQDWICDNMCEQKIEPDEHGCPALVYKSPPVTTTYAGTGSCSDPEFNGGRPWGWDGGDGGDSGDAGRDAD